MEMRFVREVGDELREGKEGATAKRAHSSCSPPSRTMRDTQVDQCYLAWDCRAAAQRC